MNEWCRAMKIGLRVAMMGEPVWRQYWSMVARKWCVFRVHHGEGHLCFRALMSVKEAAELACRCNDGVGREREIQGGAEERARNEPTACDSAFAAHQSNSIIFADRAKKPCAMALQFRDPVTALNLFPLSIDWGSAAAFPVVHRHFLKEHTSRSNEECGMGIETSGHVEMKESAKVRPAIAGSVS